MNLSRAALSAAFAVTSIAALAADSMVDDRLATAITADDFINAKGRCDDAEKVR